MSVTNIGDKGESSMMFSPEQTLKNALESIGKEGAFKKGTKLLVLCVDDTDAEYNISYHQCGMKMSECITLTEVSKTLFKNQMGY